MSFRVITFCRKAKPSDDDGVGSSATPLDSATQEGSSITTGDGDKISADDNFAGDKTKQKRCPMIITMVKNSY